MKLLEEILLDVEPSHYEDERGILGVQHYSCFEEYFDFDFEINGTYFAATCELYVRTDSDGSEIEEIELNNLYVFGLGTEDETEIAIGSEMYNDLVKLLKNEIKLIPTE